MENSSNRQIGLIILLITQTLALVFYTIYVGTKEGWIFLEVAQSNIVSLTWNGQFTSDFSCYLLLSGLWIIWRNKFSLLSIVIALFAMVLGIIIFAPYVLYLLLKEKGNLSHVLIGNRIM